MKNISDYINDISGKHVILRADLDVPVADGRISETFRIERQKDAVALLREHAAKTLIVAHSGELESFQSIFSEIKNILGADIVFIDSLDGIAEFLSGEAKVGLLDNLRRWPGEKANDPEFSTTLANGFDAYINNAFAECHRDYASMSGIPKILPAYAGPVVIEEVKNLSEILDAPSEGKVVIIGGAKASTKVPVIKNLIDKSEIVLVGGVVANDLLKTNGVDVGASRVDENIPELLEGLDINSPKLKIPTDWREESGKIFDIGPKTENMYAQFINQAKLVIWNGPMGMFENDFSKGTRAVAEAIISSSIKSIIGGGDTVSAIGKFRIPLDKFSFVSTGGGAMLSFLAGDTLPGLAALEN
ncbi:MAG: phosphoglycerate kinase [Patescibacteria group bacterium]|mgnify:CR=1 FL=1